MGFNIYAVVYQILSKSHNFSLRYGDLATFKMAAVRYLGFVVTSQYCIAGHIFVVQILFCIMIQDNISRPFGCT